MALWAIDQLAYWGCEDRPIISTPPFAVPETACVWGGHRDMDFHTFFRTDAPSEQVLAFYKAEILERDDWQVRRDDGAQLLGTLAEGVVPQALLEDPYADSSTYSRGISQSFSYTVFSVTTRQRWLMVGQTVVTVRSRTIRVFVDPG